MTRWRVGTAILLMGLAAMGFSRKDILFYASFDNGLNADVAGGNPTATVTGEPQLVDGRHGRALLFEHQASGLVFDLSGNMNAAQGTIAFWLSADNWKGDDPNVFQTYFSTQGRYPEMTVQQIWWYKAVNLLLFARGEYVGGFPAGLRQAQIHTYDKTLDDGAACVRPGIWYHVAFTWRDGEIASYLNGKPAAAFTDPAIKHSHKAGDRFAIGFAPYAAPYAFDILCDDRAVPQYEKHWRSKIDEFTILRKRLFPSQVAQLFELGPVAYASEGSDDPTELALEPYPTMGFVKATVIPGPEVETIDHLELRVFPATSGYPVMKTVLPLLESGLGAGRLDTTLLDDGAYEVAALVVDARGKILSTSPRQPFELVREPWWHNSIGRDDKVLPPWTPLRVDNDTANVWGRAYEFAGHPLPRQVRSAGKDLLAAPMTLELSLDGKPRTLAWQAPVVRTASPTTLVRRQDAAAGNLAIETRTTLEYDGLAILDLRVLPGGDGTLDALVLDIPLKAEHARLIHRPDRHTGFAPTEPVRFHTYCVWLGDDDRGFYWMAEDRKGWHNKNGNRALEFVPGPDAAHLRVHFVDDPLPLGEPFAIRVMYQATPVKPRPADWRKYRAAQMSTYGMNANPHQVNIAFAGSCQWPAATYAARPNPASGFASWQDYWQDQRHGTRVQPSPTERARLFGITFVPYSATYARGMQYKEEPHDFTTEYRRYDDEWRTVPESTARGTMQNGGLWHEWRASPASRSYRDYWTWQVVNVMFGHDLFDFDGIYFDIFNVRGDSHPELGTGWVDEQGRTQQTMTILACRDLNRRIYAGVKAKKPDALIVGHSSGFVNMAASAYTDILLDGENFRGSLRSENGHYSEVLTLDHARTEYTGRQFGFIPMHCAEVRYQITGKVGPAGTDAKEFAARYYRGTRELLAILLLHDSPMAVAEVDVRALQNVWKAHDRFGLADPGVAFHGYWERGDLAGVDNDKVLLSLYTHPDGRVLLVLGNLTAKRQAAVVALDRAALGLPAGPLRAFDGEAPKVPDWLPDPIDDRLPVDVPAFDVRHVLVGTEAALTPARRHLPGR